MIKSAPNKIITDGTDWRFLSELKQEPKGRLAQFRNCADAACPHRRGDRVNRLFAAVH
jgi:hypothetical protein